MMSIRAASFLGGVAAALLISSLAPPAGATPARLRLPQFFAQVVPGAGVAADDLRPAERTFILQGVENTRRLVELSRLAVSQSAASAVRDLAQQLAADYASIDRSLENLARSKSVPVPLQPTSFSEQYRELGANSGAAFDRAFIREVTAAAQRELQLCESAVAQARDSDVRDLAGSLLPVLRDHVNRATELEKSL